MRRAASANSRRDAMPCTLCSQYGWWIVLGTMTDEVLAVKRVTVGVAVAGRARSLRRVTWVEGCCRLGVITRCTT